MSGIDSNKFKEYFLHFISLVAQYGNQPLDNIKITKYYNINIQNLNIIEQIEVKFIILMKIMIAQFPSYSARNLSLNSYFILSKS